MNISYFQKTRNRIFVLSMLAVVAVSIVAGYFIMNSNSSQNCPDTSSVETPQLVSSYIQKLKNKKKNPVEILYNNATLFNNLTLKKNQYQSGEIIDVTSTLHNKGKKDLVITLPTPPFVTKIYGGNGNETYPGITYGAKELTLKSGESYTWKSEQKRGLDIQIDEPGIYFVATYARFTLGPLKPPVNPEQITEYYVFSNPVKICISEKNSFL